MNEFRDRPDKDYIDYSDNDFISNNMNQDIDKYITSIFSELSLILEDQFDEEKMIEILEDSREYIEILGYSSYKMKLDLEYTIETIYNRIMNDIIIDRNDFE